jgi:integrase
VYHSAIAFSMRLPDIPRRLDVPLVFPSARGGYADLHNFRAREWIPAVKAAGFVGDKRIYDCRHTYAMFSLAAGASRFSLSRRMGTSLDMIDRTYGHLAPDAEAIELGFSMPTTRKPRCLGGSGHQQRRLVLGGFWENP